jgi:hypothetical protein
MASQLQPVVASVVNPTPTGTPACLVNNSRSGAQSNISGLSYTRNYVFAENAMIVTTTVTRAASASIPANSSMIENIPVAAGPIKTITTGSPAFYLAASLTPIGNETTIPNPTEIDVYGSDPALGLRVRFQAAPAVEVVSNGPNASDSLQLDRLQINLPIPAAGGTSVVSYCLQRLSDNPAACGF